MDDKVLHEDTGFEVGTTNSRMELMSAKEALRWLFIKGYSAEIISDSSYLVDGITKWVDKWMWNDWKTSAGGDVKNKDLWVALCMLTRVDHKWTWVKGHSGDKWNEYCDGLCKLVAEQTPSMELKSAENCYTTNG